MTITTHIVLPPPPTQPPRGPRRIRVAIGRQGRAGLDGRTFWTGAGLPIAIALSALLWALIVATVL